MPDISMCNGENCPYKDKCYRYTATPTKPCQCYADFDKTRTGNCKHFWDNSGYEKNKASVKDHNNAI